MLGALKSLSSRQLQLQLNYQIIRMRLPCHHRCNHLLHLLWLPRHHLVQLLRLPSRCLVLPLLVSSGHAGRAGHAGQHGLLVRGHLLTLHQHTKPAQGSFIYARSVVAAFHAVGPRTCSVATIWHVVVLWTCSVHTVGL